jgi:hypothetical protein
MIVVIASLGGTALSIIFGALGWGWSRGTLHETKQERIDHEFERIVRGLSSED